MSRFDSSVGYQGEVMKGPNPHLYRVDARGRFVTLADAISEASQQRDEKRSWPGSFASSKREARTLAKGGALYIIPYFGVEEKVTDVDSLFAAIEPQFAVRRGKRKVYIHVFVVRNEQEQGLFEERVMEDWI